METDKQTNKQRTSQQRPYPFSAHVDVEQTTFHHYIPYHRRYLHLQAVNRANKLIHRDHSTVLHI